MANFFDFIIVGSGPGGAVLASRLARSVVKPKVLLLEAGAVKDAGNPGWLSERWTAFMAYPSLNWGYETTPQKHLNSRELNYCRGKCLGGSTVLNIAYYTIGPRDDYDEWARIVGDDSFDWEHAVKARKNIEAYDMNVSPDQKEYVKPDENVHGIAGPLQISIPSQWEEGVTIDLDIARETDLGLNLDLNSGNPLGLGTVYSTAYRGHRTTASSAFLKDSPDNLTIVTDALVVKVLFEGKRAVGVKTADGTEYRASKDVVLCAGAVDTPKLLLLSGIGPAEELREHSITEVHSLPGVGQNLVDHLFTVMSYRIRDGLDGRAAHFTDPEKVQAAKDEFAQHGTGPLSVIFNGGHAGWFKDESVTGSDEFKSLPEGIQNHMKMETVPVYEFATRMPAFAPNQDPAHTYFNIGVFLMSPQSRGSITLQSSDPKEPPIIDPNFFAHPFDRRNGIMALRRALTFVKHPKLAKDIIDTLAVPASDTDEDILAYWREGGISTWHPSCSVKMGSDEVSCVDTAFKVHGIQNLRVADLSVSPFLPNCHPQSVVYFIGEVAAQKMIEEYKLDG